MDKRVGKGKVMAEAVEGAEAPRSAVQLPLLGGSEAVDVAEVGERRGPGRPSGAANLATRELRAFITASHRHPLITLARIQAMDPVELAQQLKCKPVEALDRINRAAAELAPYLVGKMPVEDAHGHAVLPVIQLVDPASAAAALAAVAGGGTVLDLEPLEMAEIRHSDAAAAEAVGRSQSDASAENQVASASHAAGQVICNQPMEGDR